MTQMTLIYAYYRNPDMLALHYRWWAEMRQSIKDQISIIIVDDASPEPAIDVERPDTLPQIRIYRVKHDVPWNQNAARNIAAREAPEGWMLLTDMDHRINERNLDRLLRLQLRADAVYRPGRIEVDGARTRDHLGQAKPHPNSWIVTKDNYWRIGGYDEEFTGYGTDSMFRKRIEERSELLQLGSVDLIRYHRDIIPDASTRHYERKHSNHACDKAAITQRKRSEGRQDEIRTLSHEYERVL